MSSDTQISISRTFMIRFASMSPYRESGGGFGECTFCGCQPDYEAHHERCLWVEGRRMLCQDAAARAEENGVIPPDELAFVCEHLGMDFEEVSRDNLNRLVEAVVFSNGVPRLLRQRENGIFWVRDLPKAA
jgi:hypothetical protein